MSNNETLEYLYFIYFEHYNCVKVGISNNVLGRVCDFNKIINRNKCFIFRGPPKYIGVAEKLIFFKYRLPKEDIPKDLGKSKEFIAKSNLNEAVNFIRKISYEFELNEIVDYKNNYLTPVIGPLSKAMI